MSSGVKKLTNGVPRCTRALVHELVLRALGGIDQIERQQEGHRERRAGRELRDLTQRREIRFARQVHRHARRCDYGRRARIEARVDDLFPPRLACFEIDGHETKPVGQAVAEFDQAIAFPRRRTGPVHFEDFQTRCRFRLALRERIESRAENHVLPDATLEFAPDQILDETRAAHDRRTITTRPLRIHVGAITPAFVGCGETQADFIVEHMRHGIDLHMYRAPQRDAYGGAVGRSSLIVLHVVLLEIRTSTA